ncbi:MAG: peptidoglycan synthetase [Bacteroidales bacterium]|nr:peptidoglycan synthetase [Bacteroidota bacterium]MBL6950020.1 peptidoglycan synthetase [Bacteroidales bacterium]
MNIHFIAIGGSAMHNLAIALQQKGYTVTGSDDEIFEPSKSRLAAYRLLPPEEGWIPERITAKLDAVILGMHAKEDNPELIRARQLGLKIFSYPEYLYEQSKDKLRIVIGGSHGKTTITAMILHVLDKAGIDCDYMVGAQLEGFDVMVRLTEESPYMIFEGDEYLTSPIDKRPKFHLYKPHIALLSGIAWDHINVFPTFENYLEQFIQFIRLIEPGGTLIFCCEDPELSKICPESRNDIEIIPYGPPDYNIKQGITWLEFGKKNYPLQIFGHHNLLNLNGARSVCKLLNISDVTFNEAISSFKGASKRLELIANNDMWAIYKDFAHAPSKVKATIQAVKEQYPDRKIIACLELHTYSSLSEGFLHHYGGAMDEADCAFVYFNPHAVQLKRLPEILPGQIKSGFKRPDLETFNDSKKLQERLLEEPGKNSIFLFMSSGDFDGMDLSIHSSKSGTLHSNL